MANPLFIIIWKIYKSTKPEKHQI